MPITRLNHAVLYVRDTTRSAAFYGDVLGFRKVMEMPIGVFLQAENSTNDHDLGLFAIGPDAADSPAGQGVVGLYHLAWEVDTLDELDRIRQVLSAKGALVGATDHGSTKSLYGKDPDGLEFEICWLVPADRIDDELLQGKAKLQPLDLAQARERFGATTLGGVGVSSPA